MHKLILVSCAAFLMMLANGQSAAKPPTFEVATVKLAAPDATTEVLLKSGAPMEGIIFKGGPGSSTPDRIDYMGATLKMLLERAYGLKPDEILGPDWIDSQNYTISAKLPPNTDADGVRSMLQALMLERFAIRFHMESKTIKTYSLVVAKNGPKLQPAKKLEVRENTPEAEEARLKTSREAFAARMNNPALRWASSLGERSATVAKFAADLSRHADRPVQDKTQIDGLFSFELTWLPNQSRRTEDNEHIPSLHVAIEEQLGLELRPADDKFDVMVIDQARQMPTDN